MEQNPTIPAVLENACGALQNITNNPENQVIAGAAGAVQVCFSASSYPPTKKKKKTYLALICTLPLGYSIPSLYGATPRCGTPPHSMVLTPYYGTTPLTLYGTLPLYGTTPIVIWYFTPIWYPPCTTVLHPSLHGTPPSLRYSTASFFDTTPPLAMVLHPTLYSTPPLLRYSTHLSIWHFMPPLWFCTPISLWYSNPSLYGAIPTSCYGTPPSPYCTPPLLPMVFYPSSVVLYSFSLWYSIPFYGTPYGIPTPLC